MDRVLAGAVWVDAQPEPVEYSSTAGSFSAKVELSPDARRLTFKRVLVMGSREYLPGKEYGRLRSLFRKAGKRDDRPVVVAAA